MRLFVSLSYNGAPFCGWQSQPDAPSVQEELERALSIAFGEKISVVGAGRTDAGVNASLYYAHFDISSDFTSGAKRICSKINAILPPEIRVFDLFFVHADAHARYDAVSRTYRYFLHTEKDPFAVRSLYFKYRLDIEAMNHAAEYLLGEHDFSSFEKVGGGNLTSICTVTEARWEALGGGKYVFTITANRFLRNMVRAVVGTLLEVGGGKRSPEWVAEVLEKRDRGSAGQSAKGEALFLADVRYPYTLNKIND